MKSNRILVATPVAAVLGWFLAVSTIVPTSAEATICEKEHYEPFEMYCDGHGCFASLYNCMCVSCAADPSGTDCEEVEQYDSKNCCRNDMTICQSYASCTCR